MPYPVAAVRGKGQNVPFLPTDIAGLQLWLKADAGTYQDAAGTTPAVADADPVGLWQDQSGNGYHVSQSTDDNRPLLKLTTNGINNRAALLFDGTNDSLIRVMDDWLSTNSAGTVIAIYQLPDAVKAISGNALLSTASTLGTAMYLIINAATAPGLQARIEQRYNDTADLVAGATGMIGFRRIAYLARSNGSAYTIRINGADEALTVDGGANTGDWFADTANRKNIQIGAHTTSAGTSMYLYGLLAEIIVYNTNLTDAQVTAIEAYAHSRYDIIYPAQTITFLGDSIAATILVGYPIDLVKQWNNGNVTSYNRAVGGHTIMANMDAQVTAAASDDADIIIIELGTNDADGGDMGALQAEVEENLAELKASNTGATLYYLNVLPRWTDVGGGTPVDKSHIRAAIAAACAAQSVTCWDTFTTPWIDAADTSDGTHPTEAGHNKILAAIIARLP